MPISSIATPPADSDNVGRMPPVNPIHAPSARLAVGLGVAMCWVCATLLALIVLTRFPENQISLDIRSCYLLGGTTLALALVTRAGQLIRRPVFWLTVSSAVVLLVWIIILDRCNLVVQYQLWVERGQPGPGTCGWF